MADKRKKTVNPQELPDDLGLVGTVRFLQRFGKGRGDYTKEKYETPDPPFAELDAELKRLAANDGLEAKP